jgi:hypothetical protein
MKKFLRNILFGNIPVTEYSTITVPDGINEKVSLEAGNKTIDISAVHWLLCLDPVVFGIWLIRKDDIISFSKKSEYRMHFKASEKETDPVASLRLDFFNQLEEPDGTLILLRLREASIHHIHFIRNRLIFYRYYKKPEQDFLKLKSFSAAYSYPRRVRLISYRDGSWFNIFPMDLVGDIPESPRYVFGLRHTNTTLARIIEAKKLVVSEVPYEYKDIIYRLGKQHRQQLAGTVLPFDLIHTEFFDFPVPEWVNSYKEIRVTDTMNLGSHMLLWGEEVNEKILNKPSGHLFHIHFLHYLHLVRKGRPYPLA